MVSIPQTSSTEDAPAADTDEITVRISVPASQSGHDISVLLSPKKNTTRELTPARPRIEPLTFENPLPPKSEERMSNEVGNNDFPYVANHRRPQPANIKPFLRFSVPRDVVAKYPAGPHEEGDHHFRLRRWYSVAVGYDVGVFFDFWGNVAPLVPKGKRCAYKGFENFEGAVAYFESFERRGEIVKYEI